MVYFSRLTASHVIIIGFLCFSGKIKADIPSEYDLGCYSENLIDRLFTRPAWQFTRPEWKHVTLHVHPNKCRYQCYKSGDKLAAVQNGRFCFCIDDESAVSGLTAVADSVCGIPCNQNASGETCGGYLHNEVFKVPDLVENLKLADPGNQGFVTAYDTCDLSATITKGALTQALYEVQDGTIPYNRSDLSETISHSVRGPGYFSVKVTTTDNEDNKVSDARGIKSEIQVRLLEIYCTRYIAIYHNFECVITLSQGTDTVMTIDFDDGRRLTVEPPDTIPHLPGTKDQPYDNTITNSADKIYLMTNKVVRYNGTIVAWDYEAASDSGEVYFQVWRPSCVVGKKFCFRSYTCIDLNTDCKIQPNRWAKRCAPLGGTYSIGRAACVSNTNNQIIKQAFADDWSSMPVQDFVFVNETRHNITRSGKVFFTLPLDQQISVLEGDVLGLHWESSSPGPLIRQAATTDPLPEFQVDYSSSGFAARNTAGYSMPSGSTVVSHTGDHLVMAHVVRPMIFKIQHDYTLGLNVYNISVDVNNDVTPAPVTITRWIDVQEIILNISFVAKTIEKTNQSILYSILPHPGNRLRYSWDFGDGNVTNTTDVKIVEHTFTHSGVYTVRLYSWNEVSQEYFSYVVIIQDEIFDLVLNPAPSPANDSIIAVVYRQPAKVNLTIAQGTNVTYEIYMGDGRTNMFFYHDQPIEVPDYAWISEHNGLAAYIEYVYPDIGNYTMTVNVSNLVGWRLTTVALPVQIVIENLQLHSDYPMPHNYQITRFLSMDAGSHVLFTPTYSGAVIANWSMPNQRYGVLDLSCGQLATENVKKGETTATGYTVITHGSTNNAPFSGSAALEIPHGTSGGYTVQIDRHQFNRNGNVKLDINFKQLTFSVTGASAVTITVNAQYRKPFVFNVAAPNSPFDSDSVQVTEVSSGDSVLLDAYLADDILEGIQVDVTDNSGSGGPASITALETVFEYCGYQGDHGYVVIEPEYYKVIGSHYLNIRVENLVTVPFYVIHEIPVEYIIENYSFVADEHFVIPGTTVYFNITMTQGSRYIIKADYDYYDSEQGGQVYEEIFIPVTVTGDVVVVPHAFMVVDNCTVNLTVTNNVSTSWSTTVITVQDPVLNMTLTTDSPIPFIRGTNQSVLTLTITFAGGVPPPTNAFYKYNFNNTRPGENTTLTQDSYFVIDVDKPVVDYHPYYVVGTYYITLNISNFVSWMYFELQVDLDEPVMDLVAYAWPNIINVTDVTTIYVNQTWGSRLNITWDWMDPNDPVSTVQYYEFWYEPRSQSHFWQDYGVFPMPITATNTLQSWHTNLLVPLIIQFPIVELYLECPIMQRMNADTNWNAEYHCMIYIAKDVPPPTNVTIFVTWGDYYKDDNGTTRQYTSGPTRLTNNMTEPGYHLLRENGRESYLYAEIVHPRNYTEGGTYYQNMTLWNLVSNDFKSSFQRVIEKIVEITFTTTMIKMITEGYNHTKGGEQREFEKIAFGPDKEHFPIGWVVFYVNLTKGSHIHFDWDFDDGGHFHCIDCYRVMHYYSEPAHHNVTVNCSNPDDSALYWNIIHIQRPTNDKIAMHVENPKPRNLTFEFQIDPTLNVTTDACYFVDTHDEAALYNRYILIGNETTCKHWYGDKDWYSDPSVRKVVNNTPEVELSRQEGRNLTFIQVFLTVNRYFAELEVVNMVSSFRYTWIHMVTRGWCYPPYLNMDINLCQGDRCTEDGFKMVRRSEQLDVLSVVRLNCSSTNVVWFTFNVTTIENGTEVDASHVLPPEIDVTSTHMSTMSIRNRYLPYMALIFRLNATMVGESFIESVRTSKFLIVKSPLRGSIVGGPVNKVPWNANKTFEANAWNPDVEEEEQQEGMKYVWLQKRFCEKWPVLHWNCSIDLFQYDAAALTTECPNETNPVLKDDGGGCVINDNVIGPWYFNTEGKQKGLYRFENRSNNIFQQDTYYFRQNSTCSIMVCAMLDDRKIVFNQTLNVTQGAPPTGIVKCKSNCNAKYDKMSALRVYLQLTGRIIPGTVHHYEWLYCRVDINNPVVKEECFPFDQWKDCAPGLGNKRINLAIKGGCFANQEYSENILTYFKCQIWRSGTSNFGLASFQLEYNTPPYCGKCKVVPENGTALETEFEIQCTDDPNDPDQPLFFEISSRFETWMNYTVFHRGEQYKMYTKKKFNWPKGKSLEEKVPVYVRFRVFDLYASYCDTEYVVWLSPPPESLLLSMLHNDTVPSGSMDQAFSSGDTMFACQNASNIASIMNMLHYDDPDMYEDPQISTEAPPTTVDPLLMTDEEKEEFEQARVAYYQNIVDEIAAHKAAKIEAIRKERCAQRAYIAKKITFLPCTTVGNAKVISDAYRCLLERPSENGEAVVYATNALVNCYNKLSNVTRDIKEGNSDISSDEVALTLVTILSLIQRISSGIAYIGAIDTNTTEMSVTFSYSNPLDYENPIVEKTCTEVKDAAESMSLRIQGVKDRYVQLMADLMVVGESTVELLSDTGAGSFVAEPFMDDIMGAETTIGGIRCPNMTSMLNMDSFSSDADGNSSMPTSIKFQAGTDPNNIYTYIGNGTDPERNGTEEVLRVEGNVVGLSLKTPDGAVIPVNNTAELIRIEIPNQEERKINRTDAETTKVGDRMVMHQVEVRPNSSLHISIYEWINRTTNGTNETTTEMPDFTDSEVKVIDVVDIIATTLGLNDVAEVETTSIPDITETEVTTTAVEVTTVAPCAPGLEFQIIEQGQPLPEGWRVSAGGDIASSAWGSTDPMMVPSTGNIRLRNIHYNKWTYLQYLQFKIAATTDVQLNITKRSDITSSREIVKVANRDTDFDSRWNPVTPGNVLLEQKLGDDRLLELDISFDDFFSADGTVSSIQNIAALFCVKEVWSTLRCSGGPYETLHDGDIQPGYNITVTGDASVIENQTHYFSFNVTGTATLRVENIRDDTDIKYNELNFLYQDLESVILTIDTRENRTYQVQLTELKDVYLGSGDKVENLADGATMTLEELLGDTPLNYVEVEATRKAGATRGSLEAFTVTFCTSDRLNVESTLPPDLSLWDYNESDYTFTLFIRADEKPGEDYTEHDFNCTLPVPNEQLLELLQKDNPKYFEDNPNVTVPELRYRNYYIPEFMRWTCVLTNDIIDRNYTSMFFVGLKHNYTGNETVQTTQDPNALGTLLEEEEPFVPYHYEIEMYTLQCLYWDPIENAFKTDGCQVSPVSDLNITVCQCNHLTDFASGFVVPMNSINLDESAFGKLNENPLVFSVMVSCMCLYLVILIWAKKKDKIDEYMAGAAPLPCNDPRDKYLYELVCYTGTRSNAGTTAKVYIVLMGENGETWARQLKDTRRRTCKRSGVDMYVMASPQPLGPLTHLRIWHDNGGHSPSWFFSRLQVTDLQKDEQYFFICDRWLAVEEEDGLIDRLIPVAGTKELTNFNHLFWKKTRKNMTDSHIWFSVLSRPRTSRFTRVQRLTCCICLLFTSMMASILFYKTEPTNSAIYVGIISSLIAFPANAIIVVLFRYAKPRPPKKKKDHTDIPFNSRPSTALSTTSSERSPSENRRAPYMKERSVSFYLEEGRNMNPDAAFDEFYDIHTRNDIATPSTVVFVEPCKTPVDNTVDKESEDTSKPKKKKDDGKKKKFKFALPWWSIYIGYGFAFCVVGVSFWVTVEVAGVFGKDKAGRWLTSFAISIVESVFMSQPVKVLVIAAFYALVIRKPDTEEEERDDTELKQNEEWQHQNITEQDLENDPSLKKRLLKPPPAQQLELDEDYVKEAREERFKEIKMQKVLWEVVAYVIFLYMLMTVAYGTRDPITNRVYDNYQNIFSYGSFDYNTSNKWGTWDAHGIRNSQKFFQWLQQVVLPGLYPRELYAYSGEKPSWMSSFVSDMHGHLVGSPRLRQLRIKEEPCVYPVSQMKKICRPSYGFLAQDEEDYLKGWKHVNKSDPASKPDQYWKYQEWHELDGYPYWATHATYSGGGYEAQLGRNMDSATAVVDELIQNKWIDDHTRAVFVEFLIYNPTVNLFAISMLNFEFPDTGGCFVYYKFHVMRLDRYVGVYAYVVLGAEIGVALFLLYFMVREFRKWLKLKGVYFKDPWAIFELLVMVLMLSTIVMYFYRLFQANSLSKKMTKDPNKFHNFQSAAMWDESYTYLLSIVVFLSTIKFMKLLRFNKRIGMLSSTLQLAAKPIAQFMMMFMVIFTGYTMMAYVMFNTHSSDFASFIITMETLFSAMLNKADFKEFKEGNRIFGPTLLFFFTVSVTFIMINIFVTVICESFQQVKYDLSKQSNEYEIVDFMMDKFKAASGIGEPKHTPPVRRYKHETQKFDMDGYGGGSYDYYDSCIDQTQWRTVEDMIKHLEFSLSSMNKVIDKKMMSEVKSMGKQSEYVNPKLAMKWKFPPT